ncbi:alpha-L-rhamnosidase [Chitinophaga dinghuensis]|uniref:alpha-L-rhamnosidase n=2 Tax=Chitinophaga dinghuensis TaxID=1539050 RepID=A0A327W122_9BACT|nr:alpha-L-rhamnosidase [Chitinophaga dinghuensis]
MQVSIPFHIMKLFIISWVLLLMVGIRETRAQSPEWSRQAQWIVPGFAEDTLLRPSPIYRKIFTLHKPVQSAVLYISAHGVFEAFMGNRKIGEEYFAPGWTSYDTRLQYRQYDIKPYLQSGKNDLQVIVGEGWYRGAFGGLMQKNNYGSDPGIIAMADIRFTDGSSIRLYTDSSWQSTTGPVLHADIYGGMLYNANIQPGNWQPVTVATFSKDILVPTVGDGVKKQERIPAVRVFTAPNGDQLVDFGQNLAGWVSFRVKGKKNDTIRISHAEVLDKNGNFYTGNLREATATDTYILKGNSVESFEPMFTWHGFRYIKVEGCKPLKENFTAIALYTAMQPTGSFSCSDPGINQLQQNISWSLKGNFLDIPTDCPQRSERLGWTGDAQVFFRTAAFNFNVRDFYAKWLQDLRADQRPNGSVPTIIPWIYRNLQPPRKNGVAGWSDAATIVPWQMYQVYGDTAILTQQYASMKAWVDHIQGASTDGLWTVNGYGDWLAPGDSTSLPFIDQCFWAYSTQLLINTAAILGHQDDVQHYTSMLQQVKSSFLQHYMKPEGYTMPNTQTSYVLALELQMLPDSIKPLAAKRLDELVKANNNHLATGFLGTPWLLHALSNNGYVHTAYDLLKQDTWPSWLYPVKMGATTIWEKWNAILPDSNVQATSYNHYAYGAVGDWLYRVVGGIDAAASAYKKINIHPIPGGGITWVKCSYISPYGKIVSNWQLEGEHIKMQVEIPNGATATIYVPGKGAMEVKAGKYNLEGNISPQENKLSKR